MKIEIILEGAEVTAWNVGMRENETDEVTEAFRAPIIEKALQILGKIEGSFPRMGSGTVSLDRKAAIAVGGVEVCIRPKNQGVVWSSKHQLPAFTAARYNQLGAKATF